MNEYRYCSVTLEKDDTYYDNGYSPEAMSALMSFLPEGSKICAMFCNSSTMTIRISNSLFKEVPEACAIPKVNVTYHPMSGQWSGDFSSVMEDRPGFLNIIEYDNKSFGTYTASVPGNYTFTLPSASSGEIKFIKLSYGTQVIDGRTVNAPLSKYDDGTFVYKGPYDGSQFNDIGIPLDKACSHEMKEYVGLTARYNYCTKCDYKHE